MGRPMHETGRLAFDGRDRRRRPHPRAARSLGDLPRAPLPRPGPARRGRRRRSRSAGDRGRAVQDEPARIGVGARGHGRPRPRRHPEGPRADLPRRGAVRLDGPRRARGTARRRGHRRRRPLHDHRPALGGRAGRPRAQPGLHPGVQPLDLRVLRTAATGSSPPRTSRSAIPWPPPRSWNEPSARGQGRVRGAVHPRRPAARTPRQRSGVRGRAGPRRAVRDPPDLRAAVDEGHADGWRGSTSGNCDSWRR